MDSKLGVDHNYACADKEVLLLRINGGGHTWPGTSVRIAPRLNGPTSMNIDATGTMIAFFKSYGL